MKFCRNTIDLVPPHLGRVLRNSDISRHLSMKGWLMEVILWYSITILQIIYQKEYSWNSLGPSFCTSGKCSFLLCCLSSAFDLNLDFVSLVVDLLLSLFFCSPPLCVVCFLCGRFVVGNFSSSASSLIYKMLLCYSWKIKGSWFQNK